MDYNFPTSADYAKASADNATLYAKQAIAEVRELAARVYRLEHIPDGSLHDHTGRLIDTVKWLHQKGISLEMIQTTVATAYQL